MFGAASAVDCGGAASAVDCGGGDGACSAGAGALAGVASVTSVMFLFLRYLSPLTAFHCM